MQDHLPRFRWLTEKDPVSFLSDLPLAQDDRRALLWSPTPRAQKAARTRGYEFPPAPQARVLTEANAKENLLRFRLPGPRRRAFVRSRAELFALLQELESGETLRAKRRLSFAGRAQRRLCSTLLPSDERFVEESLAQGGLLVESHQDVEREWSLHGVVWGGPCSFGGSSEISVSLGSACAVETDAYGSVIRIERSQSASATLASLGTLAAQGLAGLGYFGPFGVDFLETESGLVPSDINARFTLGWSIGVGTDRGPWLDRMFAQ